MSAVLGGDEAEVLARLEELDLVPANRNAAGQIVAAGAPPRWTSSPRTRRPRRGCASWPPPARSTPTSWRPATDAYAARGRGVTTAEPTATLLSNADGQPVASAADAMAKLVAQLTRPVRWDLCTETHARSQCDRDRRVPARGHARRHRQTRTSGGADARRQDPR